MTSPVLTLKDLSIDFPTPGGLVHAVREVSLTIADYRRFVQRSRAEFLVAKHGYVATRAGDSHFVNGPENLVHLHRMRALSDAVLRSVIDPGEVERERQVIVEQWTDFVSIAPQADPQI